MLIGHRKNTMKQFLKYFFIVTGNIGKLTQEELHIEAKIKQKLGNGRMRQELKYKCYTIWTM